LERRVVHAAFCFLGGMNRRSAMARTGSIHGRGLAASGGLYAAIGVGLAAYAAHAASGPQQHQLQWAALFAFGHGVALAALAPMAQRPLERWALSALWLGVLLFSGSLAAKALAQWPVVLAPLGGSLLIAGWLLYAVDQLRR
jgi:uncharacterized membrane protein YgdD (TMEM256/DUF423 family)